jgi:nicotinate-nucleotide adenylyltransferase
MRLGLFGGTFDPIHQGHLDVARAARRAAGLDRVALLPAHTPPHRAEPKASGAHRFAMVALAVVHEDGLAVSDFDMVPTGPSYTCATLDRAQAHGLETRALFFVIGADAFAEIASWRDYPALLDRCHFIVVSRPDRPAPRLRALLPLLADRMIDVPLAGPCPEPSAPSIFLVDAPTAPVSSTEIRQRVAAGVSIHGLVPETVERHIITNELYGSRASASGGVA